MAIPSSPNAIHFGALADNRSSASRADISLRQESILFASGAVGPTATSRDNLNTIKRVISAPELKKAFKNNKMSTIKEN